MTPANTAGSPLELSAAGMRPSAAAPGVHPLATPLVGGTVLKASLPGTVLLAGQALPGAATVFTQNQRGRTKASQQPTIVVTVGGMVAKLQRLYGRRFLGKISPRGLCCISMSACSAR